MRLTTPKPLNVNLIENPIHIGHHIRNQRLKKGLLQKEVAIIIGVTEDCITYWENGRSKPMKKYHHKIEGFLKN
jgi:ribosome-binding protein aMBF1 (putative translation factor)